MWQNYRVQNALARVVTESSRRDHIDPVLKELHWLPVSERIKYKVALITFKKLSTQQPQYLANLVTPYKLVRDLRSSTQHRLTSHRTNKVIGERAFSVVSKTVWNSLPSTVREVDNLRMFKSRLKTHLFKLAFCA